MVCCNLCGRDTFDVIEDYEVLYKVLWCRNCHLVFVEPQPDITELQEHYNENYYSDWIEVQRKKRLGMWNTRLNRLNRFRQGGKLLDVGCGEGTFLELAKENGWEISGTEVSQHIANYASEVLDANIFCGELPDAGYSDNFFDVATIWHVLEHVADPYRYLSEIYRILRPKGLLVMAVPNVNNLVMQFAYRIIKGRKLKLFTKDEKELHLYHFSPNTLKAYLDKTGFECLKMSPDYGIIELSKKFVNMIAVIPYYCAGIHIYNSIEVFAISRKE